MVYTTDEHYAAMKLIVGRAEALVNTPVDTTIFVERYTELEEAVEAYHKQEAKVREERLSKK